MNHFLRVAVLLWSLASGAVEAGDLCYEEFLMTTGLKGAECVAQSPKDLYHTVRERENLNYGGTPRHESSVVDAFYGKYYETLRTYNDTHHATIAKARQPLRKLFYHVTDQFGTATGDVIPNAHDRVNAFVEHVIARFSDPRISPKVESLGFSADDAGAYLRARFVLVHNATIKTPDFESFGREITSQLRGIASGYSIDPRTLHYFIATFADHFQIHLNPLVQIVG